LHCKHTHFAITICCHETINLGNGSELPQHGSIQMQRSVFAVITRLLTKRTESIHVFTQQRAGCDSKRNIGRDGAKTVATSAQVHFFSFPSPDDLHVFCWRCRRLHHHNVPTQSEQGLGLRPGSHLLNLKQSPEYCRNPLKSRDGLWYKIVRSSTPIFRCVMMDGH